MNDTQNKTEQDTLAALGRSLGRSRTGQLLVSIAIAALFCSLAYAAWHARDLAATVLSIGLLVYGFQLAWRLLPISRATRDRWAREQQAAERHPACRYRGFLWAGIGIAGVSFFRSSATKPFDSFELIVPGIFVVIGAFSYWFCRRSISNDRNA